LVYQWCGIASRSTAYWKWNRGWKSERA
jgi:hypothetical protein